MHHCYQHCNYIGHHNSLCTIDGYLGQYASAMASHFIGCILVYILHYVLHICTVIYSTVNARSYFIAVCLLYCQPCSQYLLSKCVFNSNMNTNII